MIASPDVEPRRVDLATEDGRLWEATTNGQAFRGSLEDAVAEALLTVDPAAPGNFILHVEHLRLSTADEFLHLIQVAGDPSRLELVECQLRLDLSPEFLAQPLAKYEAEHQCRPPWWDSPSRVAHLIDITMLRCEVNWSTLNGVIFTGARLTGSVFGRTDLREARFIGSDLRDAAFWNANLTHADFHQADLSGASFWGARLDHTAMTRSQFHRGVGEELEAGAQNDPSLFRQASDVYLLLKNNFNSIGRYEDAAWAYIKEQQMEKMAHYWEWRARGWRFWRGRGSFWRWLRSWTYEVLTGYGERPLNPLIAGGLTMLAFCLAYFVTGAIGSFWDSLIYSFGTFATFNLADPGMQPHGRIMNLASSLEALLGILVLALFVFTLGNRMSRS